MYQSCDFTEHGFSFESSYYHDLCYANIAKTIQGNVHILKNYK